MRHRNIDLHGCRLVSRLAERLCQRWLWPVTDATAGTDTARTDTGATLADAAAAARADSVAARAHTGASAGFARGRHLCAPL